MMLNKATRVFLCLVLLLVFGFGLIPFSLVEAAGTTTLVVHYQRADQNYQPWNLWLWSAGLDGKAYVFNGEDKFGKVATYELPGSFNSVGLIVRTDNWEKDINEDRFITNFVDGYAEIWLYSGDPKIYTEAPEGFEPPILDQVEVNVHYYRYDQNYDGWNLSMGLKNEQLQTIAFDENDHYGKIATFKLNNLSLNKSLSFKIEKKTATGILEDLPVRMIPARVAVKNGKIEFWLMQSEAKIGWSEQEFDRTPRILGAKLDQLDTIVVELNIPLTLKRTANEGFSLLVGKKNYVIKSVTAIELIGKNEARKLVLVTNEKIPLTERLVLSHKGYQEVTVQIGKVMDTKEFDEAYYYDQNDLGANYTKGKTTFRVWAPTAYELNLLTYASGTGGEAKIYPMQRARKGTWVAALEGDRQGVYYTYQVTHLNGKFEVVDPYARAVGVNGNRGMVVELKSTNPSVWENDLRPQFNQPTDAVIYELHVRDLSIAANSGIKAKGKFLGLTESGTCGPKNVTTGLDHLKELGITHLHLLPSFDYASVDESELNQPQFNWGYDPKNYNVPEGSYATDTERGTVRIKEYKQMVQTLHQNGIRVVMDVVYNHHFNASESQFHKLVPGYYFRMRPEGGFYNGSGCGNEVASERLMVRKYLVDSVVYWAREYHVDGFRFDLMGLHDLETMRVIREALDQVDPSIIIYGEGWMGGTSGLAESQAAIKANISKIKGVAAFSDDMRDGIKGHVFNLEAAGFANGNPELKESVKFGIVASVSHPQIDYTKVNYSKAPWANEPSQTINYCEAHDNLTLWDKLALTNSAESETERIKLHLLSGAMVLTSQGIPFLHAGQDFLRTKQGNENSYNASDEINQLDWARKAEYLEAFNYYRGLITLRKAHSAFRLKDTSAIQSHLQFLDLPEKQVGYILKDHAGGDRWRQIVVIFNTAPESVTVKLPSSDWVVVVKEQQAGVKALETIKGDHVTISARSAMVLVDQESYQLNLQ